MKKILAFILALALLPLCAAAETSAVANKERMNLWFICKIFPFAS